MRYDLTSILNFCFSLTAKPGGSVEVLKKAMGWIQADILKQNQYKTEVLLVNNKAAQGLEKSACPRRDCAFPKGAGS